MEQELIRENKLMRSLLGLPPLSNEDMVMKAVSLVTGVDEEEIVSRDRSAEVSLARALYCYTMRTEFHMPSRAIAVRLKRDGSSVRHNALLIGDMLDIKSSVESRLVEQIKDIIKNVHNRQENTTDGASNRL